MPDKGWSRTFDDLIPLPGGGELRTLRDAGNYIAELPKREHDAPAWCVVKKSNLRPAFGHDADTLCQRPPTRR
jgi:hypothetical protein